MISAEYFYEQNLKGKTAAEILSAIRRLKREISRLKKSIANPDIEYITAPSDDVRLFCTRKYLERAKQALIEAGGTYIPSRMERKAEEFDANLPYICKVEFEIGAFFGGYEKRIVRIDGDELRMFVCFSRLSNAENEMFLEMNKEKFLARLYDLRIGEWRRMYWNRMVLDGEEWSLRIEYSNGHKPIKIEGINAYPYNFDELQEFLGYEPCTEEIEEE